jgi:5,6-dimethylbenzimidazole synthase
MGAPRWRIDELMEDAMDFAQADAETLLHILQWRRDVRHFRPDPVADAVLERLRSAMDYAPSVGNARPWRVIRVIDKALRDAVRADFLRCNAEAASSYPPEQRAQYLALKLAGLDRAPVQLAVFTSIDPAEGHGLGRRTLPQTLRQSTAMAVHTLWLAARSENLGLGLVSILDPRTMERLFAVPPEWEWSTYICLGHPEQRDDAPLLHRVGWQENTRTVWEER